jgi:hypothetical protein
MKLSPRRQIDQELIRLREQLQACQSRNRLALQSLRWLHKRLQVVATDIIPLEDLGEILLRIDHIHTLLSGEEGRHE